MGGQGMDDDLRRLPRLNVCCRAVVRDHYGLWSAVTEDVCAGGCRILTDRLLRPGAPILVTLSSDLFPEELEIAGRVAWARPDLMGVVFSGGKGRARNLPPASWMEKVIEHGSMPGPRSRVLPALMRTGLRRPTSAFRRADDMLRLPIRRS